jgi:hypothetical protein
LGSIITVLAILVVTSAEGVREAMLELGPLPLEVDLLETPHPLAWEGQRNIEDYPTQ